MSCKVELNFTCKNLPNMDNFSKSDAKIFAFIESEKNNNKIDSKWIEIGTTEKIDNNNNPVFKKSIVIDYNPNINQNLRFIVFDMDNDSEEWKKNDFIGYVEKSINALLNDSKDNIYSAELLTSIPSGFDINNIKAQKYEGTSTLLIRIEKITDTPAKIRFSVSGSNLDKKDSFGLSDSFIRILLIEDNNELSKVFETPVYKNSLNPTWEKLEIPVKTLNKGDPDKILIFEVWDWDKGSSNDLIGTFKATTNDLFNKREFEIINEKLKSSKSNYKNSGVIRFNKIEYV